MTHDDLEHLYHGYIDCLNRRNWDDLGTFVGIGVSHNGARIGLDGYREMLVKDVKAIPDLRFQIAQLVCDPPVLASRLDFDCTPIGMLFGHKVDGKRVRFSEHAFYGIADGRITSVWSIIDKAAIAEQL